MRRHQSGCGGTAALALLVALAGGPAHAQLGLSGDLPRHQVRLSSLTAATYNPLGLQTDLQLGYRYRLFDSKSLLLRHAFVGVFHSLRINPAYTRLGSGVELQPMAVLTLRALYELRGYFGTAGMLQSWASPYAAHDDDTNAARAEEAYRTLGHQVMLQAVLRARLGPVAVLNELTTHWFHMDLGSGDRVFYDAFFDTLVPGRGWLVANHAHLLLLGGRRLVVGVRYSVVHAFYGSALLDPSLGNPNTPTHKIGPIVAWVVARGSRRFRSPTLIAVLNWWIRSRYRTGVAVSQAVPYVIVAFRFDGTLWSS